MVQREIMSNALLASSNAVIPLQPPKASLLEAEDGVHGISIERTESGDSSSTRLGASTLTHSDGAPVDAGTAERTPRPYGILIVEDEPVLRKSLVLGFRNRGFDLWSAANGAEGVELYQQFWPLIDVVLSDVQMPVLDGVGTLDALRKINPSVRFCFMTGDTQSTTRDRLLKHGALRVFDKPFPSVANVAQELRKLADFPNQASGAPVERDAEVGQCDLSQGQTAYAAPSESPGLRRPAHDW